MMVYDYETQAGREFKHRMQFLTVAERDLLFTLTDKEQEALLKLKDPGLDYNTRLFWGSKLPDAVLEVVTQGYRDDVKSLPRAILDERNGS
jgi:hypothetical protein